MSDLWISPVLKEITSTVGAQAVSSMYFGRHCGKNVLILQHEVTLMVVFRNSDQLRPDFIKSVSSKGITVKGTRIVGNEDLLLLLDDTGRLWRLINAFEFSSDEDQRLYLLDEKCFYEWVPFKKFNFGRVLCVSDWGSGFACLGTYGNSEKKLLLLPSADSHFVKDCTFEGLRSSTSLHFHLTHVRTPGESTNKSHVKLTKGTLLVTDRFSGKTYLCSEDGRNSLINYSNNVLVSSLHFKQENCLLLAFANGKLVFHFLSASLQSAADCIVYLPRKLSIMEKCCCLSPCLLWSDGLCLHHTKVIFECHEPYVKLVHLKLTTNLEEPSCFVRLETDVLAVTVNNIYYHVRPSPKAAEKIQRSTQGLLSEICMGSLRVHQLNSKIDMISHFLYCKEVMDRSHVKDKVEMSLEKSCLVIKFQMNVVLRRAFWKVRLMVSCLDKKYVKIADLETDVSEGMLVKTENPFKSKSRVKVSLVGDFDGESLFLDLGEVGESGEWEDNQLSKHLKQIFVRRSPFCWKGRSVFNCS